MTTTPQPTDGAVAIVEENSCNCHPETCCCSDYRLLVGLDVLATGNRNRLERLAQIISRTGEADDDMAMHWIGRSPAGIDYVCQLDRVKDALYTRPAQVGGGVDAWMSLETGDTIQLDDEFVTDTQTGWMAVRDFPNPNLFNGMRYTAGVFKVARRATRYTKPEVDDAMVLCALLAGYPGKAAYSSADMTFMRAALLAALGKGGA